MKSIRRSVCCIAAGLFVCLPVLGQAADSYDLDNSHTSIIFGISHLGYSYTYGRFNTAQGNFVWDSANPAASKFAIAITTASIDSNDKGRDDHLRGPDFFNAAQFPQIVFQSTSVRKSTTDPSGKMYDVTGNFMMHGVTKQVTLPMKLLGEGQGPFGKYRCGFFCQTTLKRSEFGMTNMIPNIGDDVAVTISFEGTRTGSGSGSAALPPGSGSAAKPAGAGAVGGSSGTR